MTGSKLVLVHCYMTGSKLALVHCYMTESKLVLVPCYITGSKLAHIVIEAMHSMEDVNTILLVNSALFPIKCKAGMSGLLNYSSLGQYPC